MPTNDDALEIADRLFAAVTAGDVEAVRALYRPDTTVWHNTDGVAQSVEENLGLLGWLTANVRNLRYEEVRRHPIPNGFVQQHVLRCTSATGVELSIPACMVGAVENGRITRLEEYLDSAHFAALVAR